MAVNVGDLLRYAEDQLGKSYVFGAAGPDHFDCSGLVTYVFRKFGVSLPHHAADQATYGQSVNKGQIQAGDLVFSDWGSGPNSHVGIAVSPTKIIDAPHTGAVVRYDNLSSGYLSHVTAVRRVTDFAGKAPIQQLSPAGGGGGSGSDVGTQLVSAFEGLFKDVTRTFVGPYNEIAQPLQDIGSAASEMSAVADKVFKAFLPSNFIRICSGIGGAILILIGIWFISREIR